MEGTVRHPMGRLGRVLLVGAIVFGVAGLPTETARGQGRATIATAEDFHRAMKELSTLRVAGASLFQNVRNSAFSSISLSSALARLLLVLPPERRT